jgi:voltage-gated potassium channel
VDYVARLVLSVGKAMFVRTHKLDQLLVLLPMLRFLRIFLLLRRILAFVSTEKIAGSIVSIVIAVGFASAFFRWRVEHDAPGATMTTFRAAIWWAVAPPPQWTWRLPPVTDAGLIGAVSAAVAACSSRVRASPACSR